MRKIYLMGVCIFLSGCETIGNTADDLGGYLPVLSDERCEHWQCFTDEGKAQSDYNKQMRQQQQQAPQDPAAAQQPAPPPPPKVETDPEINPYDNYRP